MRSVLLSDEDIEFLTGVLEEFPRFVEDFDYDASWPDVHALDARCSELRTKLKGAK